ncbi:hypothetical protein ACP70R_020956 [Stipagrostis hirtigluma subsp. patula]
MAHDPSLAYADYFAVGEVPEVSAGEEADHLYAGVRVHQPAALDVFAARNLMAAASAHGDVDGYVALGEHARQQLHRQSHGNQATLMSLSLHGPTEAEAAASLALHHQHQLGAGGGLRQHQPAAWPQHGGTWDMRGSRFLLPTQQLLQEFCNLPVERTSTASSVKPPTKPPTEDGGASGGSSSSAPSARIQAMDAAELQRLKAKLYAMLEEVERRYRRYREQMRAVAGSFGAVAGERAAAAYTSQASRTISRHFRSLRDGVAAELQAVRAALGEKGCTPAGVSKGETTTPRLRVLDQCLRQHRAYHAGALESQPWRPQRGLPERAVSILRAWLFEHFLHPYPSDVDKHILARQTGLSRSQVSNWFINARVRLWKPMVEEMYAEEMRDQQDGGSQSAAGACGNVSNDPNPSSYASEIHGGGERKPTRAQLVHDAGSLASVVTTIGSGDQQSFGLGVMDHLGFDAYGAADGRAFGGGGVSLTLGLQQHADDPHGGVNVAFTAAPSAAGHEFLFMASGEQQQQMGGGVHQLAHGQHGQFGAGGMGGDAAVAASQSYHRGLSAATGFQLLHDLAG